jgi:hypothetical protein
VVSTHTLILSVYLEEQHGKYFVLYCADQYIMTFAPGKHNGFILSRVGVAISISESARQPAQLIIKSLSRINGYIGIGYSYGVYPIRLWSIGYIDMGFKRNCGNLRIFCANLIYWAET